MNAALEVANLSVSFLTDKGWVQATQDVSFSVDAGKILGIVGESGSGKTVSCLAAMGLLERDSSRLAAGGSIRLGGHELLGLSSREFQKVRGDQIAMIFQEPMTSLNPAFTIGNQVAEGLRRHRGLTRKKAQQRTIELLEMVGISDPKATVYYYPHALSGGMRQRAMIAMALACEPQVLVADEPTTALDVTVQAQILDLIRSMRDELGIAVVLITHDLGVIAEMCDEVAVMYAGQVVEQASVDELFEHPSHPYTEGLLASMPRLGSNRQALGVVPGRVPAPWAFPEGCRFAPRCPYRGEICSNPPELQPIADGHTSACNRVAELSLEGIR
ncbi:MAG: ABC transporter ATP-binding protein [bacterium]|nr:ABC transporter ATP-binding protein [bacterium]